MLLKRMPGIKAANRNNITKIINKKSFARKYLSSSLPEGGHAAQDFN